MNATCEEVSTQAEAVAKVTDLIRQAESLGQRPRILPFTHPCTAAWGISLWTDTLSFKVTWPRFDKLFTPMMVEHIDLDTRPTDVPLPDYHLGKVKDWLKGPPADASFVITDDVMARAFDFIHYNVKDHTSHILRVSLVQVRELLNDDQGLRDSMSTPLRRSAYGGYGKARSETEAAVLSHFDPKYVFGTEEVK